MAVVVTKKLELWVEADSDEKAEAAMRDLIHFLQRKTTQRLLDRRTVGGIRRQQ